jgi:gluconate 2-dehydrogenase gamma chain
VGATGGGYSHLVGHYREVARRLDSQARTAHQKAFAALTVAERAPIVAAFATGAKADVGYHVLGLPDPSHASDHELFEMVRRHTIEGYFGEPVHGGNRDFTAWEAIGHTHHSHYTKAPSHETHHH